MSNSLHSRSARTGFSLIELLVAMAIGLVVTLAITTVMIGFDSEKRKSTSINDLGQSGNYAAYMLDRAVRNAGTGYTQQWASLFGCKLNVQRSAASPATVLPPASYPGVFVNASLTRRLAPVLIEKGAASSLGGDIVTVMSGAAGKSEMPQLIVSASIKTAPTASLTLANTMEYQNSDLILLADPNVAAGCMVQQVGTVTSGSQILPLAGDYFSITGGTVSLTNYATSSTAVAALLGNAIGTNSPQFTMFAAGPDSTLWSFDLLRSVNTGADADNLQAVADGVIELRAVYGLDTNNDRTVDSWEDADPAHGYDYASLTNGTPAALNKLTQIVAIRFGLILRSSLQDKDPVSPASLTVFPGLVDVNGNSLTITRSLATTAEQSFRYRVIDVTVPLRNMIYRP